MYSGGSKEHVVSNEDANSILIIIEELGQGDQDSIRCLQG
jgi:hypothetical protein